jgi:hypothetical protein
MMKKKAAQKKVCAPVLNGKIFLTIGAALNAALVSVIFK